LVLHIYKKAVVKQLKYIFICIGLLFCIAPVFAQLEQQPLTRELKNFSNQLAKANISFTFPAGFKEIAVPKTSEHPFDYGIATNEDDCEIWFQVRTQKDNWTDYIKRSDRRILNADSLYREIGQLQADAFKSEKPALARSIPPFTMKRYNADLGYTYLVTELPDAQITKHYKIAMVVVLQKNKVGTVTAVYFANELGPGFFSNLNKASSGLKFN
jgi:hypothetical protein